MKSLTRPKSLRRIAGRYRYYHRECRQHKAADSNARPAADSAATPFIQWGKVVNHVADSTRFGDTL